MNKIEEDKVMKGGMITTRTGTYKEIMEKSTKMGNRKMIAKNNKDIFQKAKAKETTNRGKEGRDNNKI